MNTSNPEYGCIFLRLKIGSINDIRLHLFFDFVFLFFSYFCIIWKKCEKTFGPSLDFWFLVKWFLNG